jgi:hypothetical protein
MPRADVPVTFDPDGLLWQLADVTDSKDPNLRFNHRLELEPPSREARSPVQSRRGREREELARTWHWPPAPAPPSLPSSSTWLPYETQRWSTQRPPVPPVPPAPPPPPPPPPPRRVLAPIDDPNVTTLAIELRALERQHAALKQHAIRQQRAIRALADLGNRCAPLF